MTEGRPRRKRQQNADTLTSLDPTELGRVVDAKVNELTELKNRGDPRGKDHDDIAREAALGSTLWVIRLGKGERVFRASTLRKLAPVLGYDDTEALEAIYRKPIPRDFGVLKREIAASLEPSFRTLHDRLDRIDSRLDAMHERRTNIVSEIKGFESPEDPAHAE